MADGGTAGAILLSLVGQDEAAAMIGELGATEVAALCGAMEVLTQVDEAAIERVLADFIERARAINPVASAGAAPVRAAIEQSLGVAKARTLMKAQGTDEDHPVFAQLGWLPLSDVIALVGAEHPQVAAVVLSRIDPAVAAAALAELPDDEATDLLHRVATLTPVGRDALDDLARVVTARSGDAAPPPPVELGGIAQVAAILNRGERPAADRSIKALGRIDKGLAGRIDDARVTFADVIALPDKDLGTVVRASDAAVIARALKGVDARTCDRFLAQLSTRGAQTLRDEIDELTGLSRAEVDGAQAAIVAVARRLSDDGAIRMGGAVADYV